MHIQKNYNLSKLNTFGINADALFFTEIESDHDLEELFNSKEFKEGKKIFLGGGSNVLFTKDFDGFVVLNKLKGVEILGEDSSNVMIRAMGGEIWNDFVLFAINHEYWGIENLSLIPGTVGAAPMQNIGAYGAELNDTLVSVETYQIENGEKKVFTKEECKLGYRESVFKNELKGKYFISAVVFKLSKIPKINTSYKVLANYLMENKIEVLSPKDISKAVSSIRQSKLPDPKVLGNAGSFFKNVFIKIEELQNLEKKFPDMPHFEEDGVIKIPSGWLIEQCGWKGRKIGNVGVHEKQALVLVNYGGATGSEIIELANKIIESVKEKFDLKIVPEVNLI